MLQEILCFVPGACGRCRGGRAPSIVGIQCCHRMQRIALRDQIAGTALASAALGGHAEFHLDFVKAHSGARITSDFAVRDPATYTNNHGRGGEQLKIDGV